MAGHEEGCPAADSPAAGAQLPGQSLGGLAQPCWHTSAPAELSAALNPAAAQHGCGQCLCRLEGLCGTAAAPQVCLIPGAARAWQLAGTAVSPADLTEVQQMLPERSSTTILALGMACRSNPNVWAAMLKCAACRELMQKCLARIGQRQLACCLSHWRSLASEHARLQAAQQQVASAYRKAALAQTMMRWHQLWREKSLLRTCLQQLQQGAVARALRQWQVSWETKMQCSCAAPTCASTYYHLWAYGADNVHGCL